MKDSLLIDRMKEAGYEFAGLSIPGEVVSLGLTELGTTEIHKLKPGLLKFRLCATASLPLLKNRDVYYDRDNGNVYWVGPPLFSMCALMCWKKRNIENFLPRG